MLSYPGRKGSSSIPKDRGFVWDESRVFEVTSLVTWITPGCKNLDLKKLVSMNSSSNDSTTSGLEFSIVSSSSISKELTSGSVLMGSGDSS